MLKKIFSCFIFVSLISFSLWGESSYPTAVKGVIDLSDYDFSNILNLEGEWLFQSKDSSDLVSLAVPGNWHSLTGTSYSQGTYHLRMILPSKGENELPMAALLFPEISQILELWVNESIVYSSGNSITGETNYTHFVIPIGAEPILNLRVKLNNTQFRKGGLIYTPLFGSFNVVQRYRIVNLLFEAFFIGILLLAALSHLFLYINKYQKSGALYLSLAAFFMIIRASVTGENLVAVIFPGFSWDWDYRVEYISICMNVIGILLFSNNIFPLEKRVFKILMGAVIGLNLIYALFCLIFPIIIISRSILILYICIVGAIILCVFIYLYALLKRKPASLLFSFGGMAALVLAVMDMMYYYGGPSSFFNLSQAGMIIFIVTQTFVLSRIYGEFHKKNEQLLVLSNTDSLTGAANRHKIDEDLEKCHKVYLRYGTPYSLIMLDLDHFKKINDQFGHETGDRILKEVVLVIRKIIRSSDLLSRWGGEEFLILLPNIGLEGAAAAAEKMRYSLENHTFPRITQLTASFSAVVPLNREESLSQIFIRLDKKLYRAKEEGRNRVII